MTIDVLDIFEILFFIEKDNKKTGPDVTSSIIIL